MVKYDIKEKKTKSEIHFYVKRFIENIANLNKVII